MSQKKSASWRYGLNLSAVVLALVALVYAQVWGHQFLHWDDLGFYVYNPHLHGFTRENLWWIATSSGDGIWKPLTWLTFMLEFRFLPLEPPGPHLIINPLIHAGNAVLAGLVLYGVLSLRRKGNDLENRWAGVCLAVIMAVHPVQVEAAAWLSGRKEVLCAWFYLLAILCWLKRLGHPQAQARWYFLALAAHGLALLAKPMAVTVPVMLLVLDGVARRPIGFWKAVLEKWPFWLCSIAMVPIAIWGQLSVEALPDATQVPLDVRLAQGMENYAAYLAKVLLPVNVVPYYPSLGAVNAVHLFASTAAMLLLLALAWRDWRSGERLWFLAIAWFLVVFFPVSGWLQVGDHRVADRYAYLPVISVYAVLAATVARAMVRTPIAAKAGMAVAVCMLVFLSYQQVGIWKSDRSLWEFAATRESNSGLVMNNLGNSYYEEGHFLAAAAAYQRAISLQPYVVHYRNLIAAYLRLQDWVAVTQSAQQAAQQYPAHEYFHAQAAHGLMQQQRYAEALPWFDRLLAISPDDAGGLWGKAYALAILQQPVQALECLGRLLQVQPDHAGGKQLKAALESQLPAS